MKFFQGNDTAEIFSSYSNWWNQLKRRKNWQLVSEITKSGDKIGSKVVTIKDSRITNLKWTEN